MAFELAGMPYYFSEGYASAIGNFTADGKGRGTVCPMHLLHLDSRGKPFWFNGSIYRDKRASKTEKQFSNPQVWANSTGTYDLKCMYDVEADGGVHNMSDEGFDDLYQSVVAEAVRCNFIFDSLIK